jgi:hypothetical protein
MSVNTHHENAREALGYIESARDSYVDPTTQALMTAQTEATLALAYEQRTANLLAAFGLLGNHDEGETLLGERMDGLELAKEIKERLDFK